MNESLKRLQEQGLNASNKTGSSTAPTDFFSTFIAPTAVPEIVNIPFEELHEFNGHVFYVRDDEDMNALAEGIRQQGQIEPAIVRSRAAGGYEIISGHRRCRACQLAGLLTLKCIIVDMDDDSAEAAMLEANKRRSWIAPSERARIYEREMALLDRRQGQRTDLTSATRLPKLRWRDKVGEKWGCSGETVRQYVLLLKLVQPLLDAVDNAAKLAITGQAVNAEALQIPFKAGVSLASLPEREQEMIYEYIYFDGEISSVTKPQAAALAKLFEKKGLLAEEDIERCLRRAEPKNDTLKWTFSSEMLHERADSYLKDVALQSRIVSVINNYIIEQEEIVDLGRGT